jgi:hypothetical protein
MLAGVQQLEIPMLPFDIGISLALFSVLLGIPALYLAIESRAQLNRAIDLLEDRTR